MLSSNWIGCIKGNVSIILAGFTSAGVSWGEYTTFYIKEYQEILEKNATCRLHRMIPKDLAVERDGPIGKWSLLTNTNY
jgi:hypothetical protein